MMIVVLLCHMHFFQSSASAPKLPECTWYKKISHYNRNNGYLLGQEIVPLHDKPELSIGGTYCKNPMDPSPTITEVDKIWFVIPESLKEYLNAGGDLRGDIGADMVRESIQFYNYDSVKLLVSHGAHPNPRFGLAPLSAYLLAFVRHDYDMTQFIKKQEKLKEPVRNFESETAPIGVPPRPKTARELLGRGFGKMHTKKTFRNKKLSIQIPPREKFV